MKLNIYSIFDSAAGAYTRPFFLQSDAQAIRTFTDIASDADHEIGKHPEDYALCRIGIFNDADAKLTPESVETLITALEAYSSARNLKKETKE